MSKYLSDFKRLTTPLYEQGAVSGGGYMGGQADLTPLKNRSREAIEALNDAQKAADSGRAEDAVEALRRARAAIDAALGGHLGPNGAMGAPLGMGAAGGVTGPGRP